MSFISVLFALLLEQARPLARGNPVHATMRVWVRWCARNFDAGKPLHGWLAWTAAVGLPSLLAAAIYVLLDVTVSWALAMFWSALVLYTCLGFRQFSFHFTQIRDALAVDDEPLAKSLLCQWQHIEPQNWTRSELLGRVIQFSVLASHRHVLGVLVWFSVFAGLGLGPMGAVLYRLGEFVVRYWQHQSQMHAQPVSEALQTHAKLAWHWIDWVPARVTALSFAVVGNFEEAIDGWRAYQASSAPSNDGLLLAATAGAVNLALPGMAVNLPTSPDDTDPTRAKPALELAHLAIVVGLVWRAVVMWVVLLALLTLARLLG
ncbi:regulatory signaling modulator protein AmpE [Rhodoferax sp.]|uniref:regulatory signaling modulator protein AmpE n=1 Tax=Rhodoferax sp. TaxID=50421 RepID=UPI002633C9E2|nr:regulatory signaling modulator protein AmpE [Rhodoferax sp.]MDD2810404.1 regulatory signaling modulator protein AmpE [Rhodoferax sp.]